MTDEPEQLHTAKEAASKLGLGSAMLRRYASTYEEVSGDEITVHRRDGRLFTDEQLMVLLQARALVQRTSVDVETAVRQALEQPVQPAVLEVAQSSALNIETLIAAIAMAQREANEPLLEVLQGIDTKLGLILEENQLEQVQAALEPSSGSIGERVARADDETFYGYRIRDKDHHPEPEDGLLVKWARWLERRLRGK